MGEWQKLTAEAATLEKLVQVHRLQHRRTGYFARVLDVRRGVRAVLGKGAHLAQVEQALHAIRAAWKDLQSLLIQTYFMPYAIVHLALLSRLATLLSAHHAHLRSTLRLAPAQTQPALLALCASTSSETPSARSPRNTSASKRAGIFGGVIEPVGCASARDAFVNVFDVFVASSSPEAFFSGPRSIAFLMRFSFCAGDKSSSLSFV